MIDGFQQILCNSAPLTKARSISDDVITALCSLCVFVHLRVSLVRPERPPPRSADLLTSRSLRTSKYWTSHSGFVRWLPTDWRTAGQPRQIDTVHLGNFAACLYFRCRCELNVLVERLILTLSSSVNQKFKRWLSSGASNCV